MKAQGFNLIELLIVLSILSFMLAFALPHYTEHVVSSRRLVASAALLKLAAHLEAYFAERNTYEGADFNKLRLDEFIAGNHYRLLIQIAEPAQFKLAAVPQKTQAEQDARCGSLFLNSRGEKRISGFGKLSECW